MQKTNSLNLNHVCYLCRTMKFGKLISVVAECQICFQIVYNCQPKFNWISPLYYDQFQQDVSQHMQVSMPTRSHTVNLIIMHSASAVQLGNPSLYVNLNFKESSQIKRSTYLWYGRFIYLIASKSAQYSYSMSN